jgi:hypothetical protein
VEEIIDENKIEISLLAPLKNLLATKTRRLFKNFLSLSFFDVAHFIFPAYNS